MAVTAVIPSKVTRGVHKWIWTALTEADTGAALDPENGGPSFADKCVQMESPADWGGGTIILEGSNDGAVYSPLNNAQGIPISMTADGLEAILENPLYIRPRATAGALMSVDITIVGRAILQLR